MAYIIWKLQFFHTFFAMCHCEKWHPIRDSPNFGSFKFWHLYVMHEYKQSWPPPNIPIPQCRHLFDLCLITFPPSHGQIIKLFSTHIQPVPLKRFHQCEVYGRMDRCIFKIRCFCCCCWVLLKRVYTERFFFNDTGFISVHICICIRKHHIGVTIIPPYTFFFFSFPMSLIQ